MLRTLFWIGLLGVMAAGCTSDPSARNEPAPVEPLVTIELTAVEALAWPYRYELQADLDGDGGRETVALVCDVEVTSGGRILWEDGHRWALLVTDGPETTLAYAAFVPRGSVEVAVLRPSSGREREVLVIERTPERLRMVTIGYQGPGRAAATSAAHYQIDQIESWLPGSATLSSE